MIESMEKVHIYSMRGQTDHVVEDIMKCGAIQLIRKKVEEGISEYLEEKSDKRFEQYGMAKNRKEILLERIEKSIDTVKPFSGRKSIFHKKQELPYDKLISEDIVIKGESLCHTIEALTEDVNTIRKQRNDLQLKIMSMLPWEGFDVPLENIQTKTTSTSLYIIKSDTITDDLKQKAAEEGFPLHIKEISREKKHAYIAILVHGKHRDRIRAFMEAQGGTLLPTAALQGTFCENINRLRRIETDIVHMIEEKSAELKKLSNQREVLEAARDALDIDISRLRGYEDFLNTRRVDIISGWIPTAAKPDIEGVINKYDCFCTYEEPDGDEEPPVLLKNNRLVKPFSVITRMYSLPSPWSTDTSWAIGLFFFIFFGMMLSDAGYGIVLIAAGFGGARYLELSDTSRNFFTMMGMCGISTVFWGALYGSWFGDAVPAAGNVFFNKDIDIPKLIDPLNEPMTVLMLAFLLGVVHLFTGLGIKAYIMVKRGDEWGALFDVGFWYMVLTGLPLMLLGETWKTAGMALSIAGAVGLILTQGRHKPTLAGKIISGVMSLYKITGYFSDVLSYSRILALGLATGVVASVVNIMGTMAGGGIAGAILFIAVFVAGHSLNLGINALGAYVHSARLQYVEFFGKYYEGGGKKFDPFMIKTKYVRITEEE